MNISLSNDIEPLTEFRRNSAKFIERLRKDRKPIVLTQHGKSAAVLLDIVEFEKLTQRLDFLEEMTLAKKDVDKGNTFSLAEAKDRIAKHNSKWK